jgi:AraC-like DNA-binding protein
VYEERPSRILGGFVWTSRAAGGEKRILPDGCMDLLWDGTSVSVAGPDTHAQLFRAAPGTAMTGLRFPPGLAPRVLGVPADTLTDQRVPLDALWPAARVRRVTELVAASAAPGRALEDVALRYRPEPDDDIALVDAVAALARQGWASSSIAQHVGLSARQLQRRSVAAFGYGTKTLQRILRLQRALDLVRAGARAADSAARSGYADQAHLARDVKDLAGVPMTALAL